MFAAQVDLDYVFDPDTGQQQKNLRLLVQRIHQLGITTVLLQAFADPDGNDCAEALYFPNHALPMRADLFAQAVRALHQSGVRVFAWMPLLAYSLGPQYADLLVGTYPAGRQNQTVTTRQRLSPFHPEARAIIQEIFTDLARSAPIDGILFHDDGTLSDFEDTSAAALAAYRRAGLPSDIRKIRHSRSLMKKWSRFKTKALIDFSIALLRTVRRYRPTIRSGRAIYARAILNPASEEWLAQTLGLYLQAYDYTFILAMPYLENVATPHPWLTKLASRAFAETVYPSAVVFELQTVDWRDKHPIPTREMIAQILLLHEQGAVSFAWYPDDFFNNHPDAGRIRRIFSHITSAEKGCLHD